MRVDCGCGETSRILSDQWVRCICGVVWNNNVVPFSGCTLKSATMASDYDGMLHEAAKRVGTRTGRFSTNSPDHITEVEKEVKPSMVKCPACKGSTFGPGLSDCEHCGARGEVEER